MPRIRSVKPEFFSSEPVGNCSPTSRLLFVALWCWADDDGRMVDNPRVIRAFAFPLDDDVSSADVDGWITELHAARLVIRYEVDGRKYLAIRSFHEHQHPKKPQASKLPAPPESHEFPTSSPPVENRFPTGTPRRGEERRGVGGERKSQPSVEGGDAVAPPRRDRAAKPASKVPAAPRFPHFAKADRDAVHQAWTTKLGVVDFGRLIAAIGPLFRAPDDAGHIPHAALVRGVRDYVGLISRGRSAPYASPEDCGKRLAALAQNALAHETDPVARADGAEQIIHGAPAKGAQ